MIMNKFPIGFWNYCALRDQSPADVKDWADLGMTFACSPTLTEKSDPEEIKAILDECEKYGIKVLLTSGQLMFRGAGKEPAAYEKKFTAAYNSYGSHPAVLGFHVGDEPWSDRDFDDSVIAYNIQKKIAPELTPHINFLPYWEGQEETVLHYPTFEEWAAAYARKTGLGILCYDCYSQMNPNGEGLDMYFTDLRKFSAAAKASGAEPWTTLLSVGHFRYRVPDEDDLRWQLNTAVASGMKGIMWFFVYERAPKANYRLPPIDEFGERTETFPRLSRVNRHFLKQFGDFFNKAQHVASYHTGKSYGGYPLFEKNVTDDLILDFENDQNVPGLLGLFTLDGRRYAAAVNNSTTENACFRLHVRKTDHPIERLNWNGQFTEVRYDHHDANWYENDAEEVAGDWLAPGQLNVYRIN